MLRSILAEAKASVRRAGECDYMPRQPACEEHHQVEAAKRNEDKVAYPSEVADGEDNSNSISGVSSVSRSLYNLGAITASGASVVNKAMTPLKRALRGDPETTLARVSLTKYRNQLSSALSEASAATAKRKEERNLLVDALDAQENNLRCWGYFSILPSFREHRRRETTRADVRVNLAEHQSRILAVRHEEVTRLLKSMPVLRYWSKASAGIVEVKHGRESQGGAQENKLDDESLGTAEAQEAEGDGERVGGGTRKELAFEEEAMIVPPSDLFASNPGLEGTRRQLRACDEACAAAADAFARKVVDAGGLELRSHEERSQIVLALLSRYDVLTRTIGDRNALLPAAVRSAAPPRPAAHGGALQDGDAGGCSSKISQEAAVEASTGIHAHNDGPGDGSERERDSLGSAPSLNPDVEDRDRDVEGDGDDESRGQVPLEACIDAHASDSGLTNRMGSCPRPTGLASPTQSKEARSCCSFDDSKECEGGLGTGYALDRDVVGPKGEEEEEEWELLNDGRKACEEAFLELLSDERTREGRLLGRFLTMALAAASDGIRPLSASLRDSRRHSTPTKSNTRPAGSARGKGKEEDGAVGPKVVKAFMNYFSKEYLKERFDVPDVLLPALSELVATLVFRQARPLLLGYDGGRVKKNDMVWRDKAGKLRSLSLAQLGVPSEYIPENAKIVDDIRARDGPFNILGGSITVSLTEGDHDRSFNGAAGQTESGVTLEEAVAIIGGVPGSRRDGTLANLEERSPNFVDATNSVEVGGKLGLSKEEEAGVEREESVERHVESDLRSEISPSLAGDGVTVSANGVRREDPEFGGGEPGLLMAKESSFGSMDPCRGASVSHKIAESTDLSSMSWQVDDNSLVGDGPAVAPVVAVVAAERDAKLGTSEPLGLQMANATTRALGRLVLTGEERIAKEALKPSAAALFFQRHFSTTTRDASTAEARESTESSSCEAQTETPSVVNIDMSPEDENLCEVALELPGGVLERGPERNLLSSETTSSSRTIPPKAGIEITPRPYYCASRDFSRIGDCLTPDDMLAVVKQGMVSLAREAVRVSARRRPLDADSLLPLLVYALVHANVPRIHEAVNFIRNFHRGSGGGEQAYYLTSIEAAVSFVLDWRSNDGSTGASTVSCSPRCKEETMAVSMPTANDGGTGIIVSKSANEAGSKREARSESHNNTNKEESNRSREEEEGREELMRLGIFLENHKVQEDTVDGLSSVGWI